MSDIAALHARLLSAPSPGLGAPADPASCQPTSCSSTGLLTFVVGALVGGFIGANLGAIGGAALGAKAQRRAGTHNNLPRSNLTSLPDPPWADAYARGLQGLPPRADATSKSDRDAYDRGRKGLPPP